MARDRAITELESELSESQFPLLSLSAPGIRIYPCRFPSFGTLLLQACCTHYAPPSYSISLTLALRSALAAKQTATKTFLPLSYQKRSWRSCLGLPKFQCRQRSSCQDHGWFPEREQSCEGNGLREGSQRVCFPLRLNTGSCVLTCLLLS